MVPAEPQVLVAVTQMVLRTAVALGYERDELLAAAGIDEHAIVDRDGYIPFTHQLALGQAIVDHGLDRNFGLDALAFVRPATFGALGYVVGHCGDLAEALSAFIRYQQLLSPAVEWTLAGTTLRIVSPPPMQGLGFPSETQVGMWVKIGRELTGVDWVPRRVRFGHQPRGPAEQFTAFFGRPVEFGAPADELEFEPEQLGLPIHGARPSLQPALIRLVQSLMPQSPEPSMTDQVRALLLDELPRGMTTRQEAAAKLGISTRTLTRRLGEDNSSFRDLLTEVRKDLACAWLRDDTLPVHEVAYLLGYSEPSTFHRSFRRWTGQTPMSWRRSAAC